MKFEENEEKLRKSYICVKQSSFWTLITILGIAFIYFSLVGLGYGASALVYRNSHNMTTGQCFPDQPEENCLYTICYFNTNNLGALFGGCIPAGLISVLALIFGPIAAACAIGIVVCIIALIGMLIGGIGIGFGIYEGCKHIFKCCLYCRLQYLRESPPDTYGSVETCDETEVNNNDTEIALE